MLQDGSCISISNTTSACFDVAVLRGVSYLCKGRPIARGECQHGRHGQKDLSENERNGSDGFTQLEATNVRHPCLAQIVSMKDARPVGHSEKCRSTGTSRLNAYIMLVP